MSLFAAPAPRITATGLAALRRDDAHLRGLYAFLTSRRPADHPSSLARKLICEEREAQRMMRGHNG